MAFSTQKNFFNIPFMSERYELGCRKACVKLKSYESTDDSRAWASDETKQSNFLGDLMKCKYPIGTGEGDFSTTDRQMALTGSVTRSPADNSSVGSEKRQGKQGDYRAPKNKQILTSELAITTGGDSLLQCANVHLAEYQKLLKLNTALQKQLEVSNEHLATAKQENRKILEVLANKLDSNTAKDFYNKIQKYTTAGKFDKNEENEMLKIYQKMKNMNKSYEILQAENNYLARLIEKLTVRVKLENITIQPEQSQDISYLQNEINSLRKECLLLRQFEEKYQRSKQEETKALPSITEQDAENIKLIIKERNSLREKCKSLKALQQHVEQLQYETQEAKNEANDLNGSLLDKTRYISKMEEEIQNMQKYYEKKEQDSCLREEILKAQLEDLKREFVQAKCEAEKAHMLAAEVSCLRNQLLQSDLALTEYDCQYTQLMDVIKELRSVKLQSLSDNQTQTYQEEQTDDLTFYTCATLEAVLKELKRRGCFANELATVYGLEADPGYIAKDENEEHSATEMENLKHEIIEIKKEEREKEDLGNEIIEMKKEDHSAIEMENLKHEITEIKKETTNCEELYKNDLERVKELEHQNSQLLQDNQDLTKKLIESENKLANMLKKLEKLDEEINKNGQEATAIGKDLETNIALVKDISDVQLKNQQLANAVSAINSRDDQKIIDDLRRQLEEELVKLRKCQQDNADLSEAVKQHESSLKEAKEFNNKLLAEIDKLQEKMYTKQSESEAKHQEKTDETKYKEEPAVRQYYGENLPINVTEMQDKQRSGQEDDEVNKESLQITQSAFSKQRPIKVDQQKIADFTTDSDGFATSPSKEATRKQQKVDKTKLAPPKAVVPVKQFGSGQKKDSTLDDFVNKKSGSLKLNLQRSGQSFEKEFRKILEEFIFDCSSHFCLLYNEKSKLYIICHKLCHSGIDTLNFQELAYIHKKIYNQADKLLPGCMLDMILTEHREQVESILTSVVMPRLLQSNKLNFKTSDVDIFNDNQKCCCCKSELCCNNSEDMLKDKVSKLEKDIMIARKYLENIRSIPLEGSLSTDDNDYSTDTNNSTYRAVSPVSKQQKFCYSKQVKKLKARTKKHTEI